MNLAVTCRWFRLTLTVGRDHSVSVPGATEDMPRYDVRSTTASVTERASSAPVGFTTP